MKQESVHELGWSKIDNPTCTQIANYSPYIPSGLYPMGKPTYLLFNSSSIGRNSLAMCLLKYQVQHIIMILYRPKLLEELKKSTESVTQKLSTEQGKATRSLPHEHDLMHMCMNVHTHTHTHIHTHPHTHTHTHTHNYSSSSGS